MSCSRQSLPRPSRFYSTPSKKSNAPAFAQASLPTTDYASYMPPSLEKVVNDSLQNDLQGFLKRRPQFTMLPTPLPDDKSSALNDFYFPDSPTQDLLAIMDACLHNLYDVPRAKQVFENMRLKRPGDPILDVRVYNSFLEAYVDMATTKDKKNSTHWVQSAWELFDIMERGQEKVAPTAGTYAILLMTWLRYFAEFYIHNNLLSIPPKDSTPNRLPLRGIYRPTTSRTFCIVL